MPKFSRSVWLVVTGVVLAVGLFAVGRNFYKEKLYIALPDYPPVEKVVWLAQGWDDALREKFHHADQGTQTLGIPYEWFVALEQPRIAWVGDVGRLNDPAYLDRFGFIPGATKGGESPPPIGFAKSTRADMLQWDGKPWINPQTRGQHHAIGFTCAACHTGRLTYEGKAVIVDGGPALIDLETFRQAIGISVLFTDWIPGRFDRFARNVLGEGASDEAKAVLRGQVRDLWCKRIDVVRLLDQRVEKESVAEGYGRLDALNRIGNQVFALDLGPGGTDAERGNYRGWSAPVSYPHIWTTSHFDWVQYNASIMQPMVRNAGQALGVGAPLQIARGGEDLYWSGARVNDLYAIEQWLSGEWPYEPRCKDGAPNKDCALNQDGVPMRRDAVNARHPLKERSFKGLRAPSWPTEVLPEIKVARAAAGFALYRERCQGCHLPPIGDPAFWEPEHWESACAEAYGCDGSASGGRHVLKLVVKDQAKIGTDPAQARDMHLRKVWLPDHITYVGKRADERQPFADALGAVVELAVNRWYDEHGPADLDRRALMSGDRRNGLSRELQYKARPLDGVWATGPFLHNGSVPNVYALLSPPAQRPMTFEVGRRDYDPLCMGYRLDPVPRSRTGSAAPQPDPEQACLKRSAAATNGIEDLFEFKTEAIEPEDAPACAPLPPGDAEPTAADRKRGGNCNRGHAFTGLKTRPRNEWGLGVIGYALEPAERLAIIEFLKTDCVNGAAADKTPIRAVCDGTCEPELPPKPTPPDTSCKALMPAP